MINYFKIPKEWFLSLLNKELNILERNFENDYFNDEKPIWFQSSNKEGEIQNGPSSYTTPNEENCKNFNQTEMVLDEDKEPNEAYNEEIPKIIQNE